MDKIVNNGKRSKYSAHLKSFVEGLDLARSLYEKGEYLKSLDVYEQLLTFPKSNHFEILAEVYEQLKNLPFSDRYNLYQKRLFNFNISKNDKVLDIGSGNVPFPLATHLADLKIYDDSYGRAGVPFKFLEGKPVYEINIEEMPFKDKEFDFIYCSHVLEHVENPEKACKELMRVGKRGYVETPKYFKDLIFNTAKISNHLWKIDFKQNTIFFSSYEKEEFDGLGVDIFREMALNPVSQREKSLFSLIHLKANLFNTMFMWDNSFNVIVNETRNILTKDTPIDLNFIIIVLNGMPLIEYAIKAIYKFAKRIIIVEGAVKNCLFAAKENGSSTDGTVEFIQSFNDLDNKITFIQGKWEEKLEMHNKALEFIDSGYVWLIDSDEIYRENDIKKVSDLLQNDSEITQINFIPLNFWKGFDYIFYSSHFDTSEAHYRRVFKYRKSCYFVSHRPPTLYYPDLKKNSEDINLLSGEQMKKLGIQMYHYSYVFEKQVIQKVKLYSNYGWDKSWKINMDEWLKKFFNWNTDNREMLEKDFGPWTGDKNSYTIKFSDNHPSVMRPLIEKFNNYEYFKEQLSTYESNSLDIIGSYATQEKVLEAWRYIELDEPLRARKKIILDNLKTNKKFWNIHVGLNYVSNYLKPKSYLEVGVRTGGSLIQVITQSDIDKVVLVDMWDGNYAGYSNSIEYTKKQVDNFIKMTKKNTAFQFIQGNSHLILKDLINENYKFDLITIDGDHSEEGAWEDLCDAKKLLNDSGVIVFDDIIHPSFNFLIKLINRFLAMFKDFDVITNSTQDNGCVIFLKNISKIDFLNKKKHVKIAGEEYCKNKNLTQIDEESVFSKEIRKLLTNIKPKKIIETGTFHGKGTTKIIASTLKDMKILDSKFFSIEVNKKNYEIAKKNLDNEGLLSYVILLNGLSVKRSLLPSITEIEKNTVKSIEFDNIYVDHKENERAKLYYEETNFVDVEDNLLEKCLAIFDFSPDFVLLDSGGHMGFIEFTFLISKIKAPSYIALDDIYHIKHHKSFLFIKSDSRFDILYESDEKFGFCIAFFNPDIQDRNVVQNNEIDNQIKYGEKLFSDGNFKDAMSHFKNMLNKYPNNAEILNNYGVVCSSLGYNEEAKKAFNKAIEINPEYTIAKENLKKIEGKLF